MPDHQNAKTDSSFPFFTGSGSGKRPSSGARRLFCAIVGAVAISLVAGCGEKEGRPDHYPADVRGRVLLEDEPLKRGTVTFIPEASESAGGRPGVARIDSDGSYWVGNANPTKPTGLRPGRYKITVLSMQPDPTGTGDPIAELRTPEDYSDVSTTPLSVEIVAGPNRIDIPLRR